MTTIKTIYGIAFFICWAVAGYIKESIKHQTDDM